MQNRLKVKQHLGMFFVLNLVCKVHFHLNRIKTKHSSWCLRFERCLQIRLIESRKNKYQEMIWNVFFSLSLGVGIKGSKNSYTLDCGAYSQFTVLQIAYFKLKSLLINNNNDNGSIKSRHESVWNQTIFVILGFNVQIKW